MFGKKRRGSKANRDFFLGDWETPKNNKQDKPNKTSAVTDSLKTVTPSARVKSKNKQNGKKPMPRRALRDPALLTKKEVFEPNEKASASSFEKPKKETPSLIRTALFSLRRLLSKIASLFVVFADRLSSGIKALFVRKEIPLTTPSPAEEKEKETPQKKRSHLWQRNVRGNRTVDSPEGREAGQKVLESLDGMYGVHQADIGKTQAFSGVDWLRYGILFLCIFGFLFAGYFVFSKLYDYYRAWEINSGLQEMVSTPDFFAEEYLKKASVAVPSLTPQDIMNGKTLQDSNYQSGFTEEEENLVSKILQLKKINPDTVGWITIEGTVVNYPVVHSNIKNYYLHRDFYKRVLSGGTIYSDERNSADITQNRNTVIYGHNMNDGSMFASLHDFSNASLFYNATIRIATESGIFLYKPFSVHASNAYDNYFETDFENDSDFVQFCNDMQFMSLYETEYTFNENSQILTLSTCGDDVDTSEDRFAVHAVLVQVIR